MTSSRDRIDQLLNLKTDPSTRAQMDYVDTLASEMALYCNTQTNTYAAAELLDTAITMLAWERLRNATRPTTGSIRTLGIGHRTPVTAPGGPQGDETRPVRLVAHPAVNDGTDGDAA